MTPCDAITPDRHAMGAAATTRRLRAACGGAAERLWREKLQVSRDALGTLGMDAALIAAVGMALLVL